MRGGAIPIIAWGTILLVLAIGNAIWDAKPVNGIVAFAASLIIYVTALLLWLARHDAIRRGAPQAEGELDVVPQSSTGAVFVGLSVATILFGIVWAKFLLFFGIGILVLSLGRVVIELRSERLTNRRVRQELERR
jgi:divalent metal cation (Fe/Co/Zn/Cd) transporter